jgi:hypothetical protein
MLRSIFAALALTTCVLAPAADAAPKKKTDQQLPADTSALKLRVKPVIDMDGPEGSTFKQCFYRELQQISEVTVVQDSSQYNRFEIQLAILRIEAQGGASIGYAAAINILMPINTSMLEVIVDRDFRQGVAAMLSNASIVESQWVMTDSKLDSLCQRIAAKFDADNVEKVRRLVQGLQGKQRR